MQTQWCLVDRSRTKRSNEEGIDICCKRQRRVSSQLENSDECEDSPQIRGGLAARPRPPHLGPPPNRAAKTASQTNPRGPSPGARPPPTSGSKIRIVDSSDDDDDDDWRPQKTAPTNQNLTVTPAKVGDIKSTSNTTGQPPVTSGTKGTSTNPQNQPVKGTGTATSRPGGTPSTTTTPARLPPYPNESEILRLYRQLENMVVIWVEECLPDTFPQEFQTDHPERYWELCGWCQPLSLGNSMLQNRSWAKYVFESWVWRFFYQEIFQPGSLAWAGGDLPRESGGAAGAGKTTNDAFQNLFDSSRTMTPSMYNTRIQNRGVLMQQLRTLRGSQPYAYDQMTGGLVTEMLTAFHPYFSDVYKPIDYAVNIASLLVDTHFLITRARELDEKLRSSRHVYDLILGKQGAVCEISSDIPSPAIQRYKAEGDSRDPESLDGESIALIVVPGLLRFDIEESLYGADDALVKGVVRNARAFAQTDLLAVLST